MQSKLEINKLNLNNRNKLRYIIKQLKRLNF